MSSNAKIDPNSLIAIEQLIIRLINYQKANNN
jgi:hypothetical protein